MKRCELCNRGIPPDCACQRHCCADHCLSNLALQVRIKRKLTRDMISFDWYLGLLLWCIIDANAKLPFWYIAIVLLMLGFNFKSFAAALRMTLGGLGYETIYDYETEKVEYRLSWKYILGGPNARKTPNQNHPSEAD